MKILFLSNSNLFVENIVEYGVNVFPLFKKIPKLLRPLRILSFKYDLFFAACWYNKWNEVLDNYDVVLLSASDFSPLIAKHILKWVRGNNKIRLIYWYWNPVRSRFSPLKIPAGWETWSFDKMDCKAYTMKYNSTYYFNGIRSKPDDIKYDIMFVGQDKGRLERLISLKENFELLGLTFYLHVTRDRLRTGRKNKHFYGDRLNYGQVLNIISQSKSILDFTQDNQTGLTLRVMESLFFQKKLVTNNTDIRDYNFYRKENIFIMGLDRDRDILEFLKTPYIKIDKDIVNQYEFANWLTRIVNDNVLEDGVKEKISD